MRAAAYRRAPGRQAWALSILVSLAVAPAAAADFRGFVTDGPAGLLVFQPCRGGTLEKSMLKLSDRSPDTALAAGVSAVRQVMEDAERPLYVEFSGDAVANAVTVRRFHRAIGHVLACKAAPKDIPPGTRLHASGADPAWRFVIDGGGGRLELTAGKPVRFPASALATPARTGRTQVFDAWSAQDGGTVHVEVTEEVCLHEPSETAAGARVTLRYTTTSVEGCAARF
jgi:hypothetical protein